MPKYRIDVPVVTLRNAIIEVDRNSEKEAIERAIEIVLDLPESDLEFCESWIGDSVEILEPGETG